MLCRKHLRGSHNRTLKTALCGNIHTGGGNGGFSAAHIPLNKSVHGNGGAHILFALGYDSFLSTGKLKAEFFLKGRRAQGGKSPAVCASCLALGDAHGKGEVEKLLENHPAARPFKVGGVLRKVN